MKLLAIALFLPIYSFTQSLTPTELARCQNTAQRVNIITDQWGIPHIYGKADADAVFGLMYVQCLQNFARVERNYLEVMGRLSEVEGERMLWDDVQMQLIYDTAEAKRDYERSPEWLKKLCVAFADGVNYYLHLHPQTKPAVLQKFEPWFPLMYTDGSISATQMADITTNDTRALYGESKDASTSFNEHRNELTGWKETGSNGFAIAPARTKNKAAILYINPHVTFYFRTEVHLVSEEGLNVYGAATWGNFFVYQGFNEHCGWMHTSSYADVADTYLEKIEKVGTEAYQFYDGKRLPVRSKPLIVRYKKDGALIEKKLTGYYTSNGPVMGSRNGVWISLRERNRSLDALQQSWLRTKSKNYADYRRTMELRSNNSNNTVYADAGGNIAYWHGNFIPLRNKAFDYALPVDGSTSATSWKGVHPLKDIIQLLNPASGWIQNCNSTPFTASGKSSPRKEAYPAYMAQEGENMRAVNAARLLGSRTNLSLDDVIALGYDRKLSAFDILLPALFSAYQQLDSSNALKKELELPIRYLQQWDRYSSASSIATSLAIEWGERLLHKAPRPKNDYEATNQQGAFRWLATQVPPMEQLLLLQQTLKELTDQYKSWQVAWGDINRFQRNERSTNTGFDDAQWSVPSPLASATFGGLPAYNSSRFNTVKRYGFRGNSFVAAVEFGKRLRAKTIMTGGESFDSSSPHFTDQAEGFLNGRFKEINFYKEDVEKHKKREWKPGEEGVWK